MSCTNDLFAFEEIEGDLFTAPDDFCLAHCVSKDLRMGKGIAVKFREQFGSKIDEDLVTQKGIVGQVVFHNCLGTKVNRPYIFYMITKEKYFGKPTYDTLKTSLLDLKRLCIGLGIRKLALPKVGCGLDRLEWGRVADMIKDVFYKEDIVIRIYYYNN